MSGDCFEVAGRQALRDGSLVLVHGTVLCTTEGGTARIGQRHSHAWVEQAQHLPHPQGGGPFEFWTCVDQANGHDVELPRGFYYKMGHVEDVQRYTPDQARVLMVRTGHWGPWETTT